MVSSGATSQQVNSRPGIISSSFALTKRTVEKPPQSSFGLEGIGVPLPDLAVPMDHGKEGKIGDEVSNADSK